MKKFFALLPAFCFMLFACNDRDDTTTESTTNTSTSTNTATDANVTTTNTVVTDEKSSEFLKKVTNSGMAEVQLAKLAQQKAAIDAVKNFAAMLERDHTSVNQQVKSLADKRSVAIPTTISDDNQNIHTAMKKMNGTAFD